MPNGVAPNRGASIRLNLLGGFRLLVDTEELWPSMAEQRLLAFLALESRPQQRPHIAGTLWSESDEARANACLRTTLWRLRQVNRRLVHAEGARVSLHPEVGVDVHALVELCQDLIAFPERSDNGIGQFDKGDLLPDWYDDWLLIERERIRQLRLHALERIAIQLARAGRFSEAVEATLIAIAGEPLRESAHRALIEVHLEEGNTFEAIRQYRFFARLLERELGISPSPELVQRMARLNEALTLR